jgi:hypothetical protein
MKAIVLFTAFLLATTANSQSLKEALYGGKLKADTGAVIRKGDSAKIKESMAQKMSDDSLKMAQKISDDSMKVVQKMIADSIRREELAIEKQKAIAAGLDTTAIVAAAASVGIASSTPGDPSVAENAIPKDNNKIWKTYIDELNAAVKSEVLTSNKVKNGTYSVLIDYEIKTDGLVNIVNVASDPKNSFLEQQIKDRLTFSAPQLNPVLGTNGKPRTAAKKQMLTFVK